MGDQECAGGHTLLGNIFPQTIVEREMYVRLRNLELAIISNNCDIN